MDAFPARPDSLDLDTARDAFLRLQPFTPALLWSPSALHTRAGMFLAHWPGVVTYAVKANPMEEVVETIRDAGVGAWDVASPFEISMLGRLDPDGVRHYHNPVRTEAEIRAAVSQGVRSFSVDSRSELDKLFRLLPPGCEISVRYRLPVDGSAYNFGAKFGADVEDAAVLLARVAQSGHTASLTFHPGTQCHDVTPWIQYLRAGFGIAAAAKVRPARINVGGGFPSHRSGEAHALEDWCAAIGAAHADLWHTSRTADLPEGPTPVLVCEPGRAMVGDAFVLAVGVKAVRDDKAVFLDDGFYGALAEAPSVGMPKRFLVMDRQGRVRTGTPVERPVFGPTCDSIDRLPTWALPSDVQEGDVILIASMGAYTTVTNTRFNGFGELSVVDIEADSRAAQPRAHGAPLEGVAGFPVQTPLERARALVGHRYTAGMEALIGSHDGVRVAALDAAVSMDYRPDRITLYLDLKGEIVQAEAG